MNRRVSPGTGPRTVGVEEEFLLLDAATARAAPAAPVVVAATPRRDGAARAEAELQQEQVETGSAPHLDLAALHRDLAARREDVAAGAEREDALVVALGTHPLRTDPTISPTPRYRRIRERFGLLAGEQLTCGCHVHVQVADRDEGAAVLDRVRPWTATLLALSANSPFWQGVDSGHASYRARVWERWPSAGPTSAVGDAAGYDALVRRLLATGVPLDEGMLYFDVRLSAHYPTVEVRVADVCLRVEDAVLLAALVRALADTAVTAWRAGAPAPDVGVEVLRLAAWRAARDGVEGELLSPLDGVPRPAGDVVAQLLDLTGPALRAHGDEDLAHAGAAAVLTRGSGARWQRDTLRGAGAAEMLRRAADLTRGRPGSG